MKPTNNHDQALRALARSVQEAGERLVNLQRRIADGAAVLLKPNHN
jgi:predicted component of type VI protein secretion system